MAIQDPLEDCGLDTHEQPNDASPSSPPGSWQWSLWKHKRGPPSWTTQDSALGGGDAQARSSRKKRRVRQSGGVGREEWTSGRGADTCLGGSGLPELWGMGMPVWLWDGGPEKMRKVGKNIKGFGFHAGFWKRKLQDRVFIWEVTLAVGWGRSDRGTERARAGRLRALPGHTEGLVSAWCGTRALRVCCVFWESCHSLWEWPPSRRSSQEAGL